MRSHAGVAAQMFKALAEKGINIQAITTSEIKISVLIDAAYAELAVRTLHALYGLDEPTVAWRCERSRLSAGTRLLVTTAAMVRRSGSGAMRGLSGMPGSALGAALRHHCCDGLREVMARAADARRSRLDKIVR